LELRVFLSLASGNLKILILLIFLFGSKEDEGAKSFPSEVWFLLVRQDRTEDDSLFFFFFSRELSEAEAASSLLEMMRRRVFFLFTWREEKRFAGRFIRKPFLPSFPAYQRSKI